MPVADRTPVFPVFPRCELLPTSLSAYNEASQSLVDGMDSPWHQQVPGKREELRRMLEQVMDES